ncbi:MAG: amidohydrolase family protein, partial [Actinomycetota bacterium]
REMGVGLHTHLAETADEEAFCRQSYGVRPVECASDLGWRGPDVWYAHGVHVDRDEIASMAEAGTGVAHCPTSNMRLASGIAPLRSYLDAGVRVGLGVDGSASNDSSHLLAEARQAMLLARLASAPGVGHGPQLDARRVLEAATVGGAALLGRDDIGRIRPGMAADLVAIDLGRLEYAGAAHDPVAAVVFCAPGRVSHSWVGGRRVVADGQVVGLDEGPLVARHTRLARKMAE